MHFFPIAAFKRTTYSWTKQMPPVRRINLSAIKRKGSKFTARTTSHDSPSEEVPTKSEEKNFHENALTKTSSGQILAAQDQEVNNTTFGQSHPTKSELTEDKASGDASLVQKCLQDDFYDVPCEILAKSLLGKILVRRLDNGQVLRGRIVETECYLGEQDKASHSYKGKMTERNAPMFMKPGTTYVYLTYGMYHCFNISSRGPGAAVLIRAVEPLEGLELMADLRARGGKKKKKKKDHWEEEEVGTGAGTASREVRAFKTFKPHELCSGPSKLCIAMAIDKDTCNKRDLATLPGLSVYAAHAEDDVQAAAVVVTKRVGIESAGREWADKPLRFYLLGNASVSKRDRNMERALQTAPTAS
ncbi:DNA-3-methyladenine glycosylase [Frankliniella fusca]|uniref:DNA-3-methyladenine glycosylase II n=1 Tax=Frankliniella fusca TaxID=407009 RepID=A0AAE1LSA5_9NEOP|nr:DNA-3-methyladenine glycosylase [Frankliniella fusca]